MRDDGERLFDIAEAIERIKKYAGRGKEAFENDELIQNWIVHHLQILGEAAAKISKDFRNRHADIPWSKMIGMRNIPVHDYFGIDVDVVWPAVENDLPALERKIHKLLGARVGDRPRTNLRQVPNSCGTGRNYKGRL